MPDSSPSEIDSPPAVDVRPARLADGPAVRTLWLALLAEQAALEPRFEVAEDAATRWDNDYDTWVQHEARRLFVASSNATMVGMVTAEQWMPQPLYGEALEVYLSELYVLPAYRRYGVGQRLVAAVEAWATDCGARRLRLEVLAANRDGRRFWAARGAQPLTLTFTIDLPEQASTPPPPGRRTLGF